MDVVSDVFAFADGVTVANVSDVVAVVIVTVGNAVVVVSATVFAVADADTHWCYL